MEIDLEKYEGHTPGPWQVGHGQRGSNACMVFDQSADDTGSPRGICNVYDIPMNTRVADCESSPGMPNARLIAAAPALLAEVVRLRADLAEAVQTLEAIEIAARMRFSPADILDENSPIREGMRAVLAKNGGGK